MKKKYIATFVAIMLLAGCGTPAPAAPSTTDEPDMEAIIQQSVDEAVKEKLEQIKEEQKKKDEEIAKLAEQYKMETDKVRELVSMDDLRLDLSMRKALDLVKGAVKKPAKKKAKAKDDEAKEETKEEEQ